MESILQQGVNNGNGALTWQHAQSARLGNRALWNACKIRSFGASAWLAPRRKFSASHSLAA